MNNAELIAEYNRLTGKSIKKFSSREAGERQTAAARKGAGLPATDLADKIIAEGKAKKKPAKAKAESQYKDRNEATRETWGDKGVAKARSARDGVTVAGVAYRSVGAAFKQLGLPLGRCIGFRGKLKAAGKLTFEHNDTKYNFVITPKE